MIKQLLFAGAVLYSISSFAGPSKFIPADHKALTYSDYAKLEFVKNPAKPNSKLARMSRPLSSPGKGYNWDNPGARLRFTTNASSITVHLVYSDKHISTSFRNSRGMYYIDGKAKPEWIFTSKTKKIVRPVEKIDLVLPAPGDKKTHTYDIIMPYADSVDVAGVTTNGDARFFTPRPRPAFRCAIYGDSVTQGATATSINWTYAYRVPHIKHWQLINLGIGGRTSNPHDGTTVGKLKMNQLIVLMGVNDWQVGRTVSVYKKNMKNFILNFRKIQKTTPIILISPLWVPEYWKPKNAKADLQEFRTALREVTEELKDPNIKFIDGALLIDHDKKYFDRIAVHPNNSGFNIMTKRILKELKK